MQTSEDTVDIIDGQRFPRSGEVKCYLCGRQRESRRIAVGFGMNAMVAECPDCRIAFQSPRPSPEASLAYMNWRWRSNDAYVGSRANQMQRAMQQIAYVKQLIDRPIRLVDFGAGSGSFVRAALDEGWDATGIEQSTSARARAKEFYDIELREELGEGRYDVVTMWDVIEHLRDPQEVLARIGKHLAKDGLIFIETGNFENWRRVVQKDGWGLYLFDHQFYFSPSSLKQVLHDAGYNGFCLLDCNHEYPSIHPKRVFRHPLQSVLSWLEWALAKARWPEHGDIEVMVAVGRREPGLTMPSSRRRERRG
jgi:SAM-dependent methyltransferase